MALKRRDVLHWTLSVRSASKPEGVIEPLRVPVDVVGVLVANPTRMCLQVDLSHDDRSRSTDAAAQPPHRRVDVIEMLECSLAEDQINGVLSERRREIEVIAHNIV